jgi:hypothetical protein
MSYNKPFYIVVNPIASGFAKGLQRELKNHVTNRVYRRTDPRRNRACFVVTPRVLNKVDQFRAFAAAGVSCPPWTTDPAKIGTLGTKSVFARRLINSTGGKGIVEIDPARPESFVAAPLYTGYIPKKAEYRYHVFNGKVIDVQQKRKQRGWDDSRNTRVRNLHNGYVYCRDDLSPPAGAADLAISAVRAVGYEYGAVDLVYNEKQNKCFVLEVNSRPGLMGTTVHRYALALVDTYNLRKA